MHPFYRLSVLVLLVPALTFAGQVKTKAHATALVISAIHKFRLATVRDDCAVIDVIETRPYFEFIVRERHTSECGGTKETGPRLFNVRVSKRDGQLTSDVYDGVSYRPVDHTPK